MKKLTIGLSALAMTLTGTAYANHHGGMKPDANGDGVVTRAEAQAHASKKFAKMDVNNDGSLSDADREARREARRNKMFDALDANGNNRISREEFMAFKHEGKRTKHSKRHRGKMMMKMADTNNDGAISNAEFTAAALKRFDRTDANNDGQITKEERQTARQKMRGKWHQKMHDRSAN